MQSSLVVKHSTSGTQNANGISERAAQAALLSQAATMPDAARGLATLRAGLERVSAPEPDEGGGE